MEVKRKRPKKFVFYESEDNYAKFRVKLIEDKLKQTTFFRELVKSYLEDNTHLRAWIDENPACKVKGRSKKIKAQEDKKIKKEAENFNFDGIDLDKIFDIIAEEEKDD